MASLRQFLRFFIVMMGVLCLINRPLLSQSPSTLTTAQLLQLKQLSERQTGDVGAAIGSAPMSVPVRSTANQSEEIPDRLSPVERSFIREKDAGGDAQDDNRLRQFGYTYFSNNYVTSLPINPVAPGAEYVLGPGDGLVVRVWGKIQEQFVVTIDGNGQIFLPKAGVMSVTGMSVAQATGAIKAALGKHYVNFNVSVTVGTMRTIRINIMGDAVRPGAYEVPARTSFSTALAMAGGPNKTGTLRKVQLIRNRSVIRTIDLYEYLMSGTRAVDPILMPNDTIYISLIGPTICVDGEVRRPAIYEIKGGESIWDAIQTLSGGFNAAYYGNRVQVERFIAGQKRIVVDLAVTDPSKLPDALKSERLKNGDTVRVLPVRDQLYNYVSIEGRVLRPGQYAFGPGMTLGELVRKADGFQKDAYLNRVEIRRAKSESETQLLVADATASASMRQVLREFDMVVVSRLVDVIGTKNVGVYGDVQRPGDVQLLEGMRISDLVFKGGPNRTADLDRVELIRFRPGGIPQVMIVNVAAIQRNPKSTANIALMDRDQLYVRTLSGQGDVRRVTLGGQVRLPGTYVVGLGDRLSDVISRAGGLTANAYLPGIIFLRPSLPLDQRVSKKLIRMEDRRRDLFESTVSAQGSGTLVPQSEVQIAEGLAQEGRIILGILQTGAIPPDADIELANGDIIMVPEVPNWVQIVGGVQNPGNHIFSQDRVADDYIRVAGGYSKYARANDILVVRASGVSIRGDASIPIYPGDTVYIQEEKKNPIDWIGGIFEFSKFLVNIVSVYALVHNLK